MSFSVFEFQPALQQAIQRAKFTQPTAIQEKCIPLIKEGKNVIGQSHTGSGKTAAFGLPLLDMVIPKRGPQVLILTPTRELCHQVNDVLTMFAEDLDITTVSVYGGVGMEPQIRGLKKAEIIIATPGRLLDHLERGNFDTRNVRYLVLDEVDRMADMGFIDDVERIIEQLPTREQTLLFSATVTPDVDHLIKRHIKSPVKIKSSEKVDTSLLEQIVYNVPTHQKFSLLMHLLKHEDHKGLKLVFCATRREVDVVVSNLMKNDIDAMAIHGGMTQNKRIKSLNALHKQHIEVLVATDVAARGLDIKNVDLVFNYDVPNTAQEYTHRIGRTARAGTSGKAITLLSERDYPNFDMIVRSKTHNIEFVDVPEFERIRFVRPQQGGDRRGGFGRGPRGPPRSGGPRGGASGGHHRGHMRKGEPTRRANRTPRPRR